MSIAQARYSFDPADMVSVRNDEATALTRGMIVKRATAQDGALLPDASTDSLLGVVFDDEIAAGAYGTVQIRGQARVLAGATLTAGMDLMPTTAGKAVEWTAAAGTNAAMVGSCNQGAALDELFECELAGPNTIKQG